MQRASLLYVCWHQRATCMVMHESNMLSLPCIHESYMVTDPSDPSVRLHPPSSRDCPASIMCLYPSKRTTLFDHHQKTVSSGTYL